MIRHNPRWRPTTHCGHIYLHAQATHLTLTLNEQALNGST